MKKTLIIIIFLLSNISFSQVNIDYRFYDNCKDSILDLNYSLISLKDFSMTYSTYENDSLNKIEFGVYIVDVEIPEGENYKTFNFTKEFKENLVYNDTIELPRIMRKYSSELHNQTDLGFFECENLCNGEIVEYYKNGNVRMKGIFKNGNPKKELKKYNQKGELVEIEIYNRKGVYRKSKYPDYEKYIQSY